MPSILTAFGYRYFFYSNEGLPLEPLHIHVANGDNEAKFWINRDGTVILDFVKGNISARDMKKIQKTIEVYFDDIKDKWKEFFKEEPTYRNE